MEGSLVGPRRSGLVSLLQTLLTLGGSYLLLRLSLRWLDPLYSDKKSAQSKAQILLRKLYKNRGKTIPKIQFTDYELLLAQDLVLPENINVSFESIGGLEEVKEKLIESFILPLEKPHLFHRSSLNMQPKGILFYGPPGTGKTMLAKAIAKVTNTAFFNLNLSTLYQKWFGESEKIVSSLFSIATKLSPSIIFVDEIDTILSTRQEYSHEGTNRIKALFMTLWDGLLTDSDSSITIIGATNKIDMIDPAIRRRMPLTFHIPLPNEFQRRQILEIVLQNEFIDSDFDFSVLADNTEGYSGSDLKALCQAAARGPVTELVKDKSHKLHQIKETDQLRPLSLQDFLNAKKYVRPIPNESTFSEAPRGRPTVNLNFFFKHFWTCSFSPTKFLTFSSLRNKA